MKTCHFRCVGIHRLSRSTACVSRVGFWLVIALLVCACGHQARGRADEPPRGLATAAWKLEVVELMDGRRLEGLIIDSPPLANPESATDQTDEIGFVQIMRFPGKPMYLITWGHISDGRIRSIERLPESDHALLHSRVQAFRERRDVRLNAETAVQLSRHDEYDAWHYSGQWFTLKSSADPRLTREAIVRLEQVFGALETLVPARKKPLSLPLTIQLCATAAEYRRVQDDSGIRADNPAFYLPGRRLLVAGSDMPAIIEQQKIAVESLATAEKHALDLDRSLEQGMHALASDLEKQGIPAGQRGEIISRARSRWEREKATARAQIESARRDNVQRVEAARRGFYGWLAHEAWHAYADGHVSKSDSNGLPLWLDEGLAQVFETAPLEAGELRLDAPDPVRLALLQEMLRGPLAPTLTDLLTARQEQFLVGHAGSTVTSQRAYLMAWGLAFHLALIEPVLTPASLAALTASPAGSLKSSSDKASSDKASSDKQVSPLQHSDPIQQFEALTSMPLADFELAWKRHMLALRSTVVLTR